MLQEMRNRLSENETGITVVMYEFVIRWLDNHQTTTVLNFHTLKQARWIKNISCAFECMVPS